MSYTEKDREELFSRMKEMGDEAYLKFNERITPGVRQAYGIRVPKLRQLAKEMIRQEDYRGYLSLPAADLFEERMLRAMVLAAAPMELEERFGYLRDFVPLVDCWPVCDTLCNDFKSAEKHRKAVWDFMKPYFQSEKEFEIRFAAVMLLWHFTTEEYTKSALEWLSGVRHEGYYAKMGVAWAVSQFFVRQRELTLPFLQERRFEPWIQNKAIQKIRESYRVSREDKAYLWTLKYE